jgi:hypothetical protein
MLNRPFLLAAINHDLTRFSPLSPAIKSYSDASKSNRNSNWECVLAHAATFANNNAIRKRLI